MNKLKILIFFKNCPNITVTIITVHRNSSKIAIFFSIVFAMFPIGKCFRRRESF